MSTRTLRSTGKRTAEAETPAAMAKQGSKRTKTSKKEDIKTDEPSSSKEASEISEPSTSKPQDETTVQPSTSHNPGATQKDDNEDTSKDKASSTHLTLPESTGDIFSAPPHSLLIHACNTEGSWGAGIAAAFKSHYPAAYKIYNTHCRAHSTSLFGNAMLIPPQSSDGQGHYVGCLFTSKGKGKKKDSPEAILEATGPAMRDLMAKVKALDGDGAEVAEVRMCKINSGLFGVKWEKTKAVLEGIEVGEGDVVGEAREVRAARAARDMRAAREVREVREVRVVSREE